MDREEAERVAARMLGFTTTAGEDGILGTEDDVSAYANYQAYQQKLMGQESAMIGGAFDALGAEERARREGRLERHLQRMDESYAHMLGGDHGGDRVFCQVPHGRRRGYQPPNRTRRWV